MIQPASFLRLAAILALLASPVGALAQDVPEGHPPATTTRADEAKSPDSKSADSGKADPKSDISPLPPAAITHHTIKVGGVPLDYTAEAGTIALPGSGGKTAANIFYVAYTRDPKNTKRPITFVFNGGPGAPSTYLHLGGIGPTRGRGQRQGRAARPPSPPHRQPSTWLDITDLVFVDPVGTGYSRASEAQGRGRVLGRRAGHRRARRFRPPLSHRCGAHAVAGLPRGRELWRLPRRHASPARCRRAGGISPSGLVLISPALEFSLLNGEDYDPLPWALEPALARRGQSREQGRHRTRGPARGRCKEAERYALSRLSRRACLGRRGKAPRRRAATVARAHRPSARCRRAGTTRASRPRSSSRNSTAPRRKC